MIFGTIYKHAAPVRFPCTPQIQNNCKYAMKKTELHESWNSKQSTNISRLCQYNETLDIHGEIGKENVEFNGPKT